MNKFLLFSLFLITIVVDNYAAETSDPRMKDIKTREMVTRVKQDIAELQKRNEDLLTETALRPEGLLPSEGFYRAAYILPHTQTLLRHTGDLSSLLQELTLKTNKNLQEQATIELLTTATLVNLLVLKSLIAKITGHQS